jgi:hypothetical protein
MANDFKSALATALGIEPPPEPCPIQRAYNDYVRGMCPSCVETPLPETISFLPENFAHLVKLQTRLPGCTDWVNARWSIIGSQLEEGTFSDAGYRCDPRRVSALAGVRHLLSRPHRIHPNRRHGDRKPGNIRGKYVYVRDHRKNELWVAFTLEDEFIGKTVVTSSFYTSPQWLEDCVEMPAIYERKSIHAK